MKLIGKLIITALALLGVAYLLPGIEVENFYFALIVAVVLGVLNLIVRPLLLLITLPINILTLGLFSWVINGLIFWFVASFVDGFSVDGFVAAVLGSLIVSFFVWVGETLFIND